MISTIRKRKQRNWHIYNERLVQRYEIAFYFDRLFSMTEELKQMNLNKRGRPFLYPNSLVFIAKLLKLQFNLAYRALEGILRSFGKWLNFNVPDYTTLFTRLDKIDLKNYLSQRPVSQNLILAIDASGIKVNNYSDWMRHKFHDKAKKRRGWIKMNIIVNIETHEALDVQITKENITDHEMLIPMTKKLLSQGIKPKQILGDRGYDNNMNYDYLASKNITNGILPRANARVKSSTSKYRKEEVKTFRNFGETFWKLLRKYANRTSVERTFSTYKQHFGDTVMSKKWERIVDELTSKFWLLNWDLTRPIF